MGPMSSYVQCVSLPGFSLCLELGEHQLSVFHRFPIGAARYGRELGPFTEVVASKAVPIRHQSLLAICRILSIVSRASRRTYL